MGMGGGMNFTMDSPMPDYAALLAAIERVEELHFIDQRSNMSLVCNHCRTPWPCETIEALAGDDV